MHKTQENMGFFEKRIDICTCNIIIYIDVRYFSGVSFNLIDG